jgi:choline transport protein
VSILYLRFFELPLNRKSVATLGTSPRILLYDLDFSNLLIRSAETTPLLEAGPADPLSNMGNETVDRSGLSPTPSPPVQKGRRQSITDDDDALRLAELGYVQQLSRKFSVWSILGVGFSLTNSWFGLSAALVTGINSGGTALIIYGVIIVALISTCVAISLSELASAMPSAGGQYYWAHELASPKYKRFASYFVGWFSWAGSIFCSASVALALSFIVCGMWQLSHPD